MCWPSDLTWAVKISSGVQWWSSQNLGPHNFVKSLNSEKATSTNFVRGPTKITKSPISQRNRGPLDLRIVASQVSGPSHSSFIGWWATLLCSNSTQINQLYPLLLKDEYSWTSIDWYFTRSSLLDNSFYYNPFFIYWWSNLCAVWLCVQIIWGSQFQQLLR